MLDRPVHFLLVEDDDDHAMLIMLGLLAQDGPPKTADRVRDGEEALAYLHGSEKYASRRLPDIVLLDLKLPRMDGHQVLAAIKSDSELRSIPVIVLTTSRAPEDKARAYAHSANSYLTKPTDFGEFGKLIKNVAAYWTSWNQLRC